MQKKIEIYVRNGGGQTRLIFHADAGLQQEFLNCLAGGEAEPPGFEAYLELAVLPEWITDVETRRAVSKSGPVHVRIPITAIHSHFSE